MASLEDIRQKLRAGELPRDLVKAGYAKSSVYVEYKKLRSQLPAADEELADLRRQRDVLKLQKEIADIEAIKEKLPERVAVLEAEVVALRRLIREAVDTALAFSTNYANKLRPPGAAAGAGLGIEPEQEAFCKGWVERNIEHP